MSYREFRIGGDEANHISWFDEEKGSVYGVLPDDTMLPRVGDVLTAQTESGGIRVFRFTEWARSNVPNELFIAMVEPVGYEDIVVSLRADMPEVPPRHSWGGHLVDFSELDAADPLWQVECSGCDWSVRGPRSEAIAAGKEHESLNPVPIRADRAGERT